MVLTMMSIGEHLLAREACEWDRETRVRVWTPGGTQIGIPGVGEGENRLTFPRKFEVGAALRCQTWIRFATPDERRAHNNRWWMEYECPVCELVYATGEVAPHEALMGLVVRDGPEGRVCDLFSRATPCVQEVVEVPLGKLEGVDRPLTPPMQESEWGSDTSEGWDSDDFLD